MQRRLHQAICNFCRQPPHRRYQAATLARPSPSPSPLAGDIPAQSDEFAPSLDNHLNSAGTEESSRGTRKFNRPTRMDGTNRENIEKLGPNQKKSKGYFEDGSPRRNPLEPNKVDLYLASLRATGKEPTLADIERCRPEKRPSGKSPRYASEYHALVDRLCRTFSKEQLRQFSMSYRLDSIWSRPGRRKAEYAEAIIEKQWEWPNLKEIERHKRDITEVIIRSFPVTASELFLLLGTDGFELLQISLDYNVHISVTPNPLALRIEGLRGALKQLDTLFSSRKKAIVGETIELPNKTPIRSDLLQRMSRLAGAYIENVGYKGKVRICAHSSDNLIGAKRLAIRAAAHETHATCVPFLSYLQPDLASSLSPSIFPRTYALYPFVPPRSLPWTMKIGGAFRMRKVNEWLGDDLGDDIVDSGGLAGGKGQLMDITGKTEAIRNVLFNALPPSLSGDTRIVTASTGHVLFTSKSPSQRTSLVPPLIGFWQFPTFLGWLREGDVQRSFVSSLPAPLHNAPPSSQKIVHQLIYRSSSPLNHEDNNDYDSGVQLLAKPRATKTIKFEITLAHRVPPSVGTEQSSTVEPPHTISSTDSQSLVDAVHGAEGNVPVVPSEPSSDPEDMVLSTPEIGNIEIDMPVREETDVDIPERALCVKAIEAEFELSLPDRHMDMKLLVQDVVTVLSGQEPPVLQDYFSTLQSFLSDSQVMQPNPPLHLTDGGDHYTLETSSSIRRSTETVEGIPSVLQLDLDSDEIFPTDAISTITESILDLETNQKSTSCQISCDNPWSDSEWELFLASCDRLTTLNYLPSKHNFKATLAENKDVFV